MPEFEYECQNCGKKFKVTRRQRAKFCGMSCRIQHENKIRGAVTQSKYRQRAFEHHGEVCDKCGYSDEPKMLDVHHIDSNRRNNHINNLRVLCVWCHALITRGIEKEKPN